jgi:hypothetical protein
MRRTGLARSPLALITPLTPHTLLVSSASFKLNTSPLATIGTLPLPHDTAKAMDSRLTGTPEED